MRPDCRVVRAGGERYEQMVAVALDGLDVAAELAAHDTILLKPNLTIDAPPPVTTDPACLEAICSYCRAVAPYARIVIADGAGLGSTTWECYRALGYVEMAERCGAELLDLDETEQVQVQRADFLRFERLYLPAIVMRAYLINVPVLKGHTQPRDPDHRATVTLALKNMLGCLPRRSAQGNQKKLMHTWPIHESIVDANLARRPDLSVVDGMVGQRTGPGADPEGVFDPPAQVMLAGRDPVAMDALGAEMLGAEPREIEHLVLCEAAGLGSLDYELIEP